MFETKKLLDNSTSQKTNRKNQSIKPEKKKMKAMYEKFHLNSKAWLSNCSANVSKKMNFESKNRDEKFSKLLNL